MGLDRRGCRSAKEGEEKEEVGSGGVVMRTLWSVEANSISSAGG